MDHRDFLETIKKIMDLEKGLVAKIVHEKEEGHWSGDTFEGWWIERNRYVESTAEWVVDKPEVSEPDTETREQATIKLQQLYSEIEEEYNSCKWYQFSKKKRLQYLLKWSSY